MNISKIVRQAKDKEQVLPILDKVIVQHYTDTRMRHVGIYPSMLGKCVRAQLLMMLNVQLDKFDAQTFRKFHNGNYLHDRISGYIQLAKDKGYFKGVNFEVDVAAKESPNKTMQKFTNIVARFDAMITLNNNRRVLVEVKSMNSRSYYKPNTDLYATYKMQAQVYMLMTGMKEIVMIKECKDDQVWKEQLIKADPALQKQALGTIAVINAHLKTKTLPTKTCASKSCYDAKWCNCRSACFGLLEDWGGYKLLTEEEKTVTFHLSARECLDLVHFPDTIRRIVLKKIMETCIRDKTDNNFVIPMAGYNSREIKSLFNDMVNEKRLYHVPVKWKTSATNCTGG